MKIIRMIKRSKNVFFYGIAFVLILLVLPFTSGYILSIVQSVRRVIDGVIPDSIDGNYSGSDEQFV